MRAVFLLCYFLALSANAEHAETFSNYLKQAERNAKGLVTLYFGAGSYVTSFEQVAGGAFHLNAVSSKGGELSLFLLPDMKTLIQGTLLSQNITNQKEAHNITTLEAIAASNAKREKQLAETQMHFDRIRKGTASQLLDDEGFEDHSQPTATVKAKPLELLSSTANKTVDADELKGFVEYEKLNYVTYGQGESHIYAFIDLNCPACQHEFQYLVDTALDKNVQIHFAPVAFVRPRDSVDKAIFLFTEQDNKKQQALLERLIKKGRLGDLFPQTTGTANINAARKLQSNMSIFYEQPNPQTPYLVGETESGYIRIGTANRAKIDEVMTLVADFASHTMQSEAESIPTIEGGM